VFAKCGKVLVVSALILVIGGHWALLQSVAWIGMTINNSQTLPLKQALIKTFDGKHPCTLCKFVAHGKKSEKKQESEKSEAKLDLYFVRNLIDLKPFAFPLVSTAVDAWTARPENPPVPPPLPA
jgi:hypothetical protein